MRINFFDLAVPLVLLVFINSCFMGYTPATAIQSKDSATNSDQHAKVQSDTIIVKTALWKPVATTSILPCQVKIKQGRYKQFSLNYGALKASLLNAPDGKMEKNKNALMVELPYPDGSMQTFSITKSNIMSAELAAKYPELNTYSGVNTLQPAETVRCECTGEGFKAMITTLKGVALINNCIKKDSLTYITYYKKDIVSPKKKYKDY